MRKTEPLRSSVGNKPEPERIHSPVVDLAPIRANRRDSDSDRELPPKLFASA
jgi:hypothetical protein